MFNTMRSDISCVMKRDPAARSIVEILFCYPGYRAIRTYRMAHFFQTHHMKFLARLLSEWCRFFTGVEIHPAAEIGKRLFIDHGMGVVIGETSVIGDDVTIYQGAVLGGTGKETGKRHPTVGNHVTISAGASVLGPLNIGDYAKIGAGAVVLRDVPPFATVVGVPGRIARMNVPCGAGSTCQKRETCPHVTGQPGEAGVDLDQVHLPDPVEQQLEALTRRLEALEKAEAWKA